MRKTCVPRTTALSRTPLSVEATAAVQDQDMCRLGDDEARAHTPFKSLAGLNLKMIYE